MAQQVRPPGYAPPKRTHIFTETHTRTLTVALFTTARTWGESKRRSVLERSSKPCSAPAMEWANNSNKPRGESSQIHVERKSPFVDRSKRGKINRGDVSQHSLPLGKVVTEMEGGVSGASGDWKCSVPHLSAGYMPCLLYGNSPRTTLVIRLLSCRYATHPYGL